MGNRIIYILNGKIFCFENEHYPFDPIYMRERERERERAVLKKARLTTHGFTQNVTSFDVLGFFFSQYETILWID